MKLSKKELQDLHNDIKKCADGLPYYHIGLLDACKKLQDHINALDDDSGSNPGNPPPPPPPPPGPSHG